MVLINPITWSPEYSPNELGRMRENDGVLHAIPIPEEEQVELNEQERRAKQQQQATLTLEKRKESAWTHTKLRTLALDWAHKRISTQKNWIDHTTPIGGITENLATVEPILFEHLWEPMEFIEDMNLIVNWFENEKIVIEWNEMQEINSYGKKFMLGLLLEKHIFEQKFSISINKDDQPILRDETNNPNALRQKQMRGLQEALGKFEFSQHIRSIFAKNDNSSLMSEYIAASTYAEHPNLIDYRNSLARKVGIMSPDIDPAQAKIITESGSLTPKEKSFLLAWKDSRKDDTLNIIQKEQEKFVKYARENVNEKSHETHLKELKERPFSKGAELLAGGVIGAALLYFAYKKIKNWKVWWKIIGVIAWLIGASIMIPYGDKAWKTLWWGDSLKHNQDWLPVNRENARDNTYNRTVESISLPTQDLWYRLTARMAGSKEGIDILMNQDVGSEIAGTYPVYSMLSSLDDKRGTVDAEYPGPESSISHETIQKSFNKLSPIPNQKAQLNTLLKNTWERYKKTSKFASDGWNATKKTTLNTMLAEIEKEDGWFNDIVGFVSNKPETDAAYKVIGQNPAAWGKIPLKDIKSYFLNDPRNPGADRGKEFPEIASLLTTIPNSTNIIVAFLKTKTSALWEALSTDTLRDLLLKS